VTAHWEHFPHGADIGVRGVGATLNEAYEQAALGLTAIVTDPACVEPVQTVKVQCMAPDRELLLVDWLNAIIYEMAVRNMLFSSFELELDCDRRSDPLPDHCSARLSARLMGEPVDTERHRPAVEPKGATYTELLVDERHNGCWVAQCVVDV
jgi:SHS2 domain-containing protein